MHRYLLSCAATVACLSGCIINENLGDTGSGSTGTGSTSATTSAGASSAGSSSSSGGGCKSNSDCPTCEMCIGGSCYAGSWPCGTTGGGSSGTSTGTSGGSSGGPTACALAGGYCAHDGNEPNPCPNGGTPAPTGSELQASCEPAPGQLGDIIYWACCLPSGPDAGQGSSTGGSSGGTGGQCATSWPWDGGTCALAMNCYCSDGSRQTAGCPPAAPSCTAACCAHGGLPQCQTSWPLDNCISYFDCRCVDTTVQGYGCGGGPTPPSCSAACCSHGGAATCQQDSDCGTAFCQSASPCSTVQGTCASGQCTYDCTVCDDAGT